MFVDRDGVRKYDISEIGYERRNGYAWLGYWPEELFKIYPVWRKKWSNGR
jgi:PelA/Pel-15E family pectate lyase